MVQKRDDSKDNGVSTKYIQQLSSSFAILENITEGVLVLDEHWCIIYVNHKVERFVGKTNDELIGNILWDLFPESKVDSNFSKYAHQAMAKQVPVVFEEYFKPANVWLKVRVIPWNKGLICYSFNITERKSFERSIDYIAFHDFLTDLPNRRYFEKKLQQIIEESNQNKSSFALISLDMDRFKNINDTLGHHIGDQLVIQMAGTLIQQMGLKGFIARLGGDEFAVILDKQFQTEKVVDKIVKDFITHLEECPFKISDHEFYVTVSLGISFYPQHGTDVQSLLKKADIALYRSKEQGRDTYRIYHPDMDIDSYKRFSLEKDLRMAIEGNKLELYYQPRVQADSGKMIAAEALVRWRHPEWGMVLPKDFISIAEESGLIFPLTYWVLRTACKQIKAWELGGAPIVPISINISAHQFSASNLIDNIQQILKGTKVDGKWIEIEIAETSILNNQDLVESTIAELKKLGIKVSLDDFGTGYSSLAYLTQFKVDVLKIDRHFIRNITTNESEATVVKSIIRLGHGLGLKVVAEGVETHEQLTFLKQQDCDEIQGFIYSKPVPIHEFEKYLRKPKLALTSYEIEINYKNRRKFFRIILPFPLSSQMTIIKIKDKDIKLGYSEVVIEDIGLGGICFLSHLCLAVNEEIIYQFETEVLGEHIRASGCIVWRQEVERNTYRYGVEFNRDTKESEQLFQLLNRLALQMKKSPLVPNSRIIEIDKFKYFKENIMNN
ncbi:EAL domain-containing protein [Alkalihalobacillus sp. 1P02AB]|uniref:EAL domain-containing protein n=1 Tax=Alkalihalobacillus sp. 1P02AB TaxID=3132260 RepID=UPI0039A5931B